MRAFESRGVTVFNSYLIYRIIVRRGQGPCQEVFSPFSIVGFQGFAFVARFVDRRNPIGIQIIFLETSIVILEDIFFDRSNQFICGVRRPERFAINIVFGIDLVFGIGLPGEPIDIFFIENEVVGQPLHGEIQRREERAKARDKKILPAG